MRKLNSDANWFLRLFLLFIAFTGSIIVIFLIKPEYFIDDIELIIKKKLLNSTDKVLNIGSVNGNFLTGFKVKGVKYSEDNTIIFSAKEIFIDPDLSRIAVGTIAFSEVIATSIYYNFQSSQLDEIQNARNSTISFLNFEIESLKIDDGIFVILDKLYKLNGELLLNYSNILELDIDSLTVNSPLFKDDIFFKNGNLIYKNEEILLSNININSQWISGNANIVINVEDFYKSSASMQFDRFFLELIRGSPIKINRLNVEIDSINQVLNGVIKCDVEFQNSIYTNIFISGTMNKNIIEFDNSSLILNGQYISSAGSINILEKTWEVKVNIDEYELAKNTLISGEVALNSDFDMNHINGNILLVNSLIDSVEISSVSGQFQYNNGILISDKISVKSAGQIANLNINSFDDFDNFSINGNIKLKDFSDTSFINKYPLDSLNGDLKISWIKNFDENNVFIDINLDNGLLYDNKFNSFNGSISGKYLNDDIKVSSLGEFIGWDYYTYNWDTVKYKIDISDEQFSNIKISAISAMGDNIEFSAKKEPKGDIFISECFGSLKNNTLRIRPFYIYTKDDYYHFPKILINLGESEMDFQGNYQNNNNFEISGNIRNLELNNLYSTIGRSFRISGLIKSAAINIENHNNQSDPNPIYFLNVDMKNGAIDDIHFNQLMLTTSYRLRRMLISDFRLDTHLGNINGEGWLNIGMSDKIGLLQNEDKLDLDFTYKNVDLSRFNRYFPWGYENRGLMTGTLEISGSAEKPVIKSHMDISKPGFDKINGENLSGNILYKGNKLDFRNLLLQTKNGRYSGFGFLPLDLNFIIENRINIAKEPIDFVFTGTTNNFEFLPPYFDLLDSLTSIRTDVNNSNSYSIELLITGTLENPIRNGKVVIQNGSLYLDPIDGSIENILGLLTITNNQLIVNNLTGLLYNKQENQLISLPIFSEVAYMFEGLFSDKRAENNLKVSGSIDLNDFFNPKFALNLSGKDISLSSSYDLFRGYGSADINITGKDTIFIEGEFIPTPYNFTITNLDSDANSDESEDNAKRIISYDIHLPMKDGIKVETDNVNLLFDGDVNITKMGNENYNFSGKANIIDGKFYDNQGNIFHNTYGNIVLTPTDNTPYIDLHAQTKIEENIIDVSFIGFTDNPSLIFDSENYTQTEILKILTFGNVEGFSSPDQTGNMLSNYLENEIEKAITRYSDLDEFQLTGQGTLLENIEGKEDIELKLILGKQFSNKIYLNTELDLNDIENSQYEATYRINQNTSIVGGLDENNLWHLSYRIKFYYK